MLTSDPFSTLNFSKADTSINRIPPAQIMISGSKDKKSFIMVNLS
jgi:hypothetical protein